MASTDIEKHFKTSTDIEKHFRLSGKLIGASKAARALFKKRVEELSPDQKSPWSVQDFLMCRKRQILRARIGIEKNKVLFPSSGATVVEKWDLSLLCTILIEFCQLSTLERLDITKIQEAHKSQCHANEFCIENAECINYAEVVEIVIDRILKRIDDPSLTKDVRKIIQDMNNLDLSLTELKEIFTTSHLMNDPQLDEYRRFFYLTERWISESVNTQPSYSSKYESEFVHKRVLGRGAFGVVFEAENKVDKRSYAVKRITLYMSDTLQDTVSREVRALANLEHPNIVRYFHAWTEIPPPGWQEQKDQQRGISESKNTFSSSNTTSMVSSASRVINTKAHDGSPSINRKSQNRDGDTDKKGLTDLFLDQFANALHLQTNAYSRRESSDTWVSYNGSTSDQSSEGETTEEAPTDGKSINLLDDSSSKVVMPSSLRKKYSRASQYDKQNSKLENKNKQIEKDSNVQRSLSKDTNKNKLFFYIQMQLCNPETLAQWLEENTLDTSRERQKVLDWFQQILSAVKYVHEQGFLHRDLKPSNIFFSANHVVKVGDFGFATALEEDQYLETYSEAGTYLYMAPEVLDKRGKTSGKVDIYSLGVILFELLYSFHTQSERIKTLEDVRKLRFPENFTREMLEKKRLVSKMLAYNPEERPTANEILNEILFTEMPKRVRRETI